MNNSTRILELTKGFTTIVDAADYDWLSKWKWSYSEGYAVRGQYLGRVNGKERYKSLSLHRELLGVLPGFEVDHIDRNRLNNTRANLRIATSTQNKGNQGISPRNSSGYKGVTWYKPTSKWMARIKIEGRTTYLGYFEDILDAAEAYNTAAISYFGNFACLNEIPRKIYP